MTKNPTAIYAPTQYAPIWVGGDGSGFGGGAIGANYTSKYTGMTYDQNGNLMPHDLTAELEAEEEKAVQQVHKDLIRNRLFTEAEREEITNAKHKIALMFAQHRLAEERAIPFKYDKMVIAGGCFASLLNQEPINDIDIFLLDDDINRDLAQGMAKSYEVDQPVMIQTSGSSANTISGYISLSPKKNNNHVRIGNSNYMDNDKIERTIFFKDSRMQYITTKYKTREELINHFDFKHCCVSYDITKDKLYITRETYDLIKSKKLVQNSDRIPATWRFNKFQERGWKHEPLDVMFL